MTERDEHKAEKLSAERLAFARKVANGRPGARSVYFGSDFKAAIERGIRWRPTVAGEGVRLADTPDEGYPSRTAAIRAAKQYREAVRDFLAARAKGAQR